MRVNGAFKISLSPEVHGQPEARRLKVLLSDIAPYVKVVDGETGQLIHGVTEVSVSNMVTPSGPVASAKIVIELGDQDIIRIYETVEGTIGAAPLSLAGPDLAGGDQDV